MTRDKNKTSSEYSDFNEGTRVDLGDDLLAENTIVSTIPQTHSDLNALNRPAIENIPDLLQNAKIQMSEGFLEDAKRTLHQVLILDSENVIARQELNRIHDLEIKQIFNDSERRRTFRAPKEDIKTDDSEMILRKLDQDLNLGVFSDQSKEVTISQLSIFDSPEKMSEFCSHLEIQTLKGASPQDWIDLGIAFLEMEIYLVASRLFAGACKKLDTGLDNVDKESLVSATCLLVLTLILSGNALGAVSQIQPILADGNLNQDQRLELFYLMGRTYEALQKTSVAEQFYNQVLKMDMKYRDTQGRLKKYRGIR